MPDINVDPPIQTTYPHDRLTAIADAMGNTFHQHEDKQNGDQAIILLSDGSSRYGVGFINYPDMKEAMADLLAHVKATFDANGVKLFIGAPDEVLHGGAVWLLGDEDDGGSQAGHRDPP